MTYAGFAVRPARCRRVPGRPDRYGSADRVGTGRDRGRTRSARRRRRARHQRDHGQRAAARRPSGDSCATSAEERIRRASARRLRASPYHRDRCARSRRNVGRSQPEGPADRRARPLDRRDSACTRVRRCDARPCGLRPSPWAARIVTGSLAQRLQATGRLSQRAHRPRGIAAAVHALRARGRPSRRDQGGSHWPPVGNRWAWAWNTL